MTGRRRFLSLTAAALALPGIAAAEAPTRLLIFGDSLTAGYGLPRGRGLVPRLQSYLNRRDIAARVLNGGLSGDTTYGGRVRIGWSLARHRPDAVVVELGGNDMLAGWSVRKAEANLDAILTSARAGDARCCWSASTRHGANRHGVRAGSTCGPGWRRAMASRCCRIFTPRWRHGPERHGAIWYWPMGCIPRPRGWS